MQFKDLPLGATFDFVDDANPTSNSFYSRCKKVSQRVYTFDDHFRAQVGSINAPVFHVKAPDPNPLTYPPFTKEFALHYHDVHENVATDSRGNCRVWRHNGAVKTWKRDASRFEFGAKFGLYSAYRFSNLDANAIHCACQCKR